MTSGTIFKLTYLLRLIGLVCVASLFSMSNAVAGDAALVKSNS